MNQQFELNYPIGLTKSFVGCGAVSPNEASQNNKGFVANEPYPELAPLELGSIDPPVKGAVEAITYRGVIRGELAVAFCKTCDGYRAVPVATGWVVMVKETADKEECPFEGAIRGETYRDKDGFLCTNVVSETIATLYIPIAEGWILEVPYY